MITALSAERVTSDKRELPIDEVVAASSLVPSSNFVPNSNFVVREGKESVRRALEEVATNDGRVEETSEDVSFVEIMGSLEGETGGESEGFTFADILQRADFMLETLLEGVVDALYLPLC